MDFADPGFLARYPFVSQAREYVSGLGLSFEEMLGHVVYSSMLTMGVERVSACLEKGYSPDFKDEREARLVILSYPVARMMAASIGRSVFKRYAEGEAHAAAEALAREPREAVEHIMEELGIGFSDGSMHFTEYVRLAAPLGRKNPRWKLVNRVIDAGHVQVDDVEMADLLREAIRARVAEPLDLAKIPKKIKQRAAELKPKVTDAIQVKSIEELDMDALPPCMKGLMDGLETGEAGHQGMFILATFLANLGLSEESILGVYSRSPKFDHEKTAYQLKYVTGEAGGTEYTCPACPTIKSNGLCRGECNVKHPLQFYRARERRSKVIKAKKK